MSKTILPMKSRPKHSARMISAGREATSIKANWSVVMTARSVLHHFPRKKPPLRPDRPPREYDARRTEEPYRPPERA